MLGTNKVVVVVDPKTFWKTMKKILPGEKRATSPNISVNGSVTLISGV